MFHPHLFQSFHSLEDLHQDIDDKPFVAEKSQRLTLWRDSLRKKSSISGIPDPPDGRRWSDVGAMKKLSYVPNRESRLTGLRDFFETQGDIIVPSQYKTKSKDRHKLFYLIPRNVTITYGPYYYLGILDYRLERLHGLQAALKFAGANPHLRASQHINHLSIWYLEKEIFSCKITDLHHGGDGELDRLCYNAALAFATSAKKALLHVRHKYKFDKEKGNLFKKCPCPRNPFDFDDDDDDEEEEEAKSNIGAEDDDEEEEEIHRPSDHEFFGEDEDPFEYPDFRKLDQFDDEDEGESDEMQPPTKRIPRIFFKPIANRIPMKKGLKVQRRSQQKQKQKVSVVGKGKVDDEFQFQDQEEEYEYPGEEFEISRKEQRKTSIGSKKLRIYEARPYLERYSNKAYDRRVDVS